MSELRDLIPDEYRRRGRHVEAAWMEICFTTKPDLDQFAVQRMMFFTGAAFMYDVIVKVSDDRNGKILNQICKELGEFAEQALLENETAGNA